MSVLLFPPPHDRNCSMHADRLVWSLHDDDGVEAPSHHLLYGFGRVRSDVRTMPADSGSIHVSFRGFL